MREGLTSPQGAESLGVAAFDDGDFGGAEVVEFVDEGVDFVVGGVTRIQSWAPIQVMSL